MPRARPIEIVHLAYTTFPADTRVKREALAAATTGRRVAVIALRAPAEAPVERLGPLTVVRLPGTKARGGPLQYLAEYLAFTVRCRRLLQRDPRFARVRIVHVHTLPDFLAWAAGPAQRRGARVILDLHEIFPEFARAKYRGVPGAIAEKAARVIERQARRRADVTVTVNAATDELLGGRPIGRAERRIIVHNSADPDDFGPARDPAHRPGPTPLEIIYHGSLTALYGLDVAIRGMAAAGERGVAVRLTILGDGPERPALEALARRCAGEMISFEDRIPQPALPARLLRCDAGVVPTRLDGMTRYSLSNKLLEYAHLGLPLLTARLPSYARYLPDDAAWYWTPGDPTDFARALAEFAAATPAERIARAGRAQRSLAAIAWPHERARLLAVYGEFLARV